SVGTGTMVSDGLTFINADFSSTSFTMSRTAIGARNFLGNNIAYPAQGRTGDNCLLGTKVMIPIDGEVREGVGLLGSPPFEIPRSVQRDSVFDEYKHGDEQRRRLAAKNRHNLITMAIHLFVRWVFFSASLLIALVAGTLLEGYGEVAVQTALIAELGLSVAYFTLVGRATTGFRDLKPRFCSVYDRHFWRHERYWKVPSTAFIRLFNGTPVKGVIWRLLGVRVGDRLFDDGCGIVERTLVSVGNDCTLNAGSVLQGHSLEDGTFKSDHITLGDDCTLGINAFVHYGVRIGDGAVLDPDSFLMKGEEVRPHAQWRGNPATERTAGSSTNTAAVTLPVTPLTESKPSPAPRTGARPQRPGQRGTHPQRPAGPAHRRRAEPSPDGRGRHRWSEPRANIRADRERDTS
ncbi:MAG TPA: DapH/DapD/GlmU-related protein, partial [Nakamurella sp.]